MGCLRQVVGSGLSVTGVGCWVLGSIQFNSIQCFISDSPIENLYRYNTAVHIIRKKKI